MEASENILQVPNTQVQKFILYFKINEKVFGFSYYKKDALMLGKTLSAYIYNFYLFFNFV